MATTLCWLPLLQLVAAVVPRLITTPATVVQGAVAVIRVVLLLVALEPQIKVATVVMEAQALVKTVLAAVVHLRRAQMQIVVLLV
jgi:hypothetical protein